ncbi:MAG: hypothetical protein ACRDBY_10180 [Cetobacterium sp.]
MRKGIWLFILLAICIKSYSKTYTLQELDELKNQGIITFEDYKILKNELTSEENSLEYFTLTINSKRVSNDYKVVKSKKEIYFSLDEFLKLIKFGNYKKTEDKYEFLLGKSLRKVTLNLKESKVIEDGTVKTYDKQIFINDNNEIYLNSEIFKEIFLTELNIDESYLKIGMELNFMTPDEIDTTLDIEAKKLANQNEENILMYKSERQLFDLGYSRVIAERTFTKNKGEKSYKGEWNSGIEYQGGLLYGQLKTKYDFEDNNIEYATLEYNNIWNGHTFTLENRGPKKSGREWGLSFFKDKGYYIDGNRAIIRETVPVGSRVELRYMGASIAIKNEEDGNVIFDNPIIKTDRTYELLIYTPEGQILKKLVTTVKDYNKQEKNQIQYTVLINENHESKRYSKNLDFFYGLTDSLTFGAGYKQGVEKIDNNYEYINDGTASIVYGSTINGYSYILDLKMEKSFDDYNDNNKSYKDKFKYDGTGQLNVGKFKYILKNTRYGKFYSQEKEESIEVQWDALESLRLGYTYGKTTNYSGEDEKKSNATLDFNKSYKGLLFSLGAEIDEKSKQSYNVGVYHTGKNNISTKIETKWTSGKENDMETILSVYNNNFLGMFDYNFEAGYSQMYKDKFTFSFTMNYDNWLKIASTFNKDGNQNHSIGLDRIIDLKNPGEKITSIDVSRVKAITYIDENNNNQYDDGEKRVDGVEVTLGEKVKTTDSDGEALFSNISNGVIYNLKPKIKKPSFTIGDNKVQIKSDFSSTVEAYIPVKPMVNLSGLVKIDENLGLNELEKEQLYEDILVEIRDLKGNSLDLTIPDNTGAFDISGLFPEEYLVEVQYIGTRFKVPGLKKKLKLYYSKNGEVENTIEFEFEKNKIIAKN